MPLRILSLNCRPFGAYSFLLWHRDGTSFKQSISNMQRINGHLLTLGQLVLFLILFLLARANRSNRLQA
jgi:hypothetical protein